MTVPADKSAAGFHEGELAVQHRAGVTRDASRLSGMLAPARLGGGIARFLEDRTFAAITARDEHGTLWISPLTGSAGFLDVTSPTTLDVRALPVEGDPLRHLPAGQPVGVIVVEFATRRRLRINGEMSGKGSNGLRIDVEQAYGNCPQYIQRRHLHAADLPTAGTEPVRHADTLAPDDVDLIGRSDTLLVGTTHPTRGNDASHRGGDPGFVRVQDGQLWWPDYSGNNMFNTLGNIEANPETALLFCDFTTARTLHLSGRAVVEWTDPGAPGDDDHTGRRVRFTPQHVVAGRLLPVRADSVSAAPDNPPLSGRVAPLR
ncbi:pyridoxamine 5'-phosphate oxidase family protein [Streptomyces sp. NBC_00687]|uniref:pyridoxamine 5'-phosphate oxidase family protein n=1 Tax=Streptomyces sp. NBC_00687 TaxID=2975807 RepID=UPI0022566D1B|nr:pyridoxamine 5'-phosphate oxidase family protein [Streptomyces sp. NBC_00687]MCX4919789.1 pyridoxamine 5'-phosphate oxidase family protein [Streptomyces sp. NBC_00687]